ncbi:MAG TPA: head decoration protein [Armatimonadota bacterium]|jgi:hypothetical protein
MAKTEGRFPGEFIVSEGNGTISRETVTIVSGAGVITPGMVLGKITTGGKYTPFAPGASDGSQTAAVIAYGKVDATSADASCVVIMRYAEVNASELNWGSATAGQITTGLASLATATIFARTGV